MKIDYYFRYFSFALIVGIVMGSGCVSEANSKNTALIPPAENFLQDNNSSIYSNTTPSWIIINSMGREHSYETLEINGTTNLGVDEKLHYSITRVDTAPQKISSGGCIGMTINGSEEITSGDTPVVYGGPRGNIWSFFVKTSDPVYHYPCDIYVVTITSEDRTIQNTTRYNNYPRF
jgi:hypothetical protein